MRALPLLVAAAGAAALAYFVYRNWSNVAGGLPVLGKSSEVFGSPVPTFDAAFAAARPHGF